MEMMEQLKEAADYIRQRTQLCPRVALVLGSGLGGLADDIEAELIVPFGEIPHFPVSTVSGHKGRLILGRLQGTAVAVMQGRVHYYEGYSMQQVVFPIRLMKLLGAQILFLTNAAGGIRESFVPGDFMLITGHIGSLAPSPLIGPNEEALQPRFPDMSQVYDLELQACIRAAAKAQGIGLQEGVYLQVTGPAYETPEEIRMYRAWGADAVGMSTACEATAARAMGMRVCGVAFVSNKASGMSGRPLDHGEVQREADLAALRLKRLVTAGIAAMGEM